MLSTLLPIQAGNWDIEINDGISPDSVLNGSCYVNAASLHQQPIITAIARAKVHATSKVVRASTQPQAQVQEGALVLQEVIGSTGSSRVVVDAFLARKLRQHQKEGVQFLYNVRTGA